MELSLARPCVSAGGGSCLGAAAKLIEGCDVHLQVKSEIRAEAGFMRKILIVGFSCTELGDGYAASLDEMLTAEDQQTKVFRCGLGGLGPHIIPSALCSMNELYGPFSHVILEISTSIYAWNTRDSPELAEDLAKDILCKAMTGGAQPAILLLYRHEQRPPVLAWNDILRRVADEIRCPVVDLAEGLIGERGLDYVVGLLRDITHTTKEGGIAQANLVFDRLNAWFKGACAPALMCNSSLSRGELRVSDATGRTSGYFERRDAVFPYVEIGRGERLRLAFEKPILSNGFTFLFGPWGGRFDVVINDGSPFEVDSVDQHSYYERMGLRAFGTAHGRYVSSIEFRQGDLRPNVALLKGRLSAGPPKMRLVSVLTLSPNKR